MATSPTARASAVDTAQMATMSAVALTCFTAGDYERARQCLKELESSQDPRVLYNTAVLDFYRKSSCCDPSIVLSATVALLPADVGEDARMALAASSDVAPPLASTLTSLTHPPVLAALRTAMGFVPIFNVAVVAYQSGHVFVADKFVTHLFSHVEAMEDWLAFRTCFLAIDLNLRKGDLGMVGRVVKFVERLVPALATNPAGNVATSADDQLASTSNVEVNGEPSGFPEPSVHFEKVTPPWHGARTSVLSLPTSLPELKFCMHMYAARLGAAQGDAKLLRKESKGAVVFANDCGTCPTAAALLIKAKLDLNAAKVLRVMESIHSQAPARVQEAVRPLLLNNLGVIHHRLGRHALASLYFERSRTAFSALSSKGISLENSSRLNTFSMVARGRDSHVTYNLGLQHLQLGHFRVALALFCSCARSDEVLSSRSAMLWIRISECCIGEANKMVEQDPVSYLRGRGRCRRYVLKTPRKPDAALMQYAALCARTALSVIDKANPPSTSFPSSVSGDDIAESEGLRQRCSALVLIAYATLHFDPHAAIAACDELVTCSRPGDSDHAVLGRLYGAEALCMLGRPDDAADRLSPLLAMSGTSMAAGREGAFVNVALAHTLRGDMAAAVRAAKAALNVTAKIPPGSSPRRNALMVAAYVSLRDGNMDAARQILSSTR